MTERIKELAEQIYSTYFGHLDDKGFHEEKVAEISDWLSDGDPQITEVEAIGEWEDYDEDVITYANKPVKVANVSGKEIDYDAAVNQMDDELREQLHGQLSPCTEQEFFTAYELAHLNKFGEVWEMSKENPVW